MAMSTDTDPSVKAKADKQLSEHTSRYGHLMQVNLNVQYSLSYNCILLCTTIDSIDGWCEEIICISESRCWGMGSAIAAWLF